jgi:phosphoribosyl-AMP cyclohydrolase
MGGTTMRKKLGTFRYPVEVVNATGDGLEVVEPWVDTGALYSQFPELFLRRLGYAPNATRRFRLADGSVSENPIGPVSLRIGDETQPVICVFSEEDSDPLLGATTLEAFSLSADPSNETLNPTIAMRLSLIAVEDTAILSLDFDKLSKVGQVPGVLPCAVQNADTNEVILVAYVNQEALDRSLQTRSAVFWSTSRNELWEKGKTSGETFELVEVRVNCEQNSLLYRVRPRRGGICHTKNAAGAPRNCFYRTLDLETRQLRNLDP